MAGKTKLYPPLRLCAEKETLIGKFESVSHVIENECFEDFIAFEMDNALGKFETVMEIKFGIPADSRKGKLLTASMTSQVYDDVFATIILAEWRKNKQVYCIPRELYDMLVEMDDFDIEMSIFKYLPYEAFYLELQDVQHIDGILVRYNPKTCELAFCIIFKPNCDFTESGVNGGFFTSEDNGSFKEFIQRQSKQLPGSPDDEGLLAIQEALKLVLQASMYLCAKNADIEENPLQKGIYRPSAVIKNRYAEVRKWDVGLRVVKEHKRMSKAAQEETHKHSTEGRKRPRQHWRKAHWHTYLVGPGRKERELKFIAPMLINDIGDEMPVVKHE